MPGASGRLQRSSRVAGWSGGGRGGNLCAWACPYGARELDPSSGTLKKCTLCVDRVHDERLPDAERQPACVLACPAHARMFGDFDDPQSDVSRAVRERRGYGLMPELGYKPVNQYLPQREVKQIPVKEKSGPAPARSLKDRIKQFSNRMISR